MHRVSDLTDDRGSGAPGRVTSQLSTVVNLELGQAVVLAGLSAESQLKSKTGVPVLSQIPVLGYLFGSERMTKQSADNVVFIVPSVINGTSRAARRSIKKAFEAYRHFKGAPAGQDELRRQWEESGADGQ